MKKPQNRLVNGILKLILKWPERGSNPHGGYPPRDFKSRASANFAIRPGACAVGVYRSCALVAANWNCPWELLFAGFFALCRGWRHRGGLHISLGLTDYRLRCGRRFRDGSRGRQPCAGWLEIVGWKLLNGARCGAKLRLGDSSADGTLLAAWHRRTVAVTLQITSFAARALWSRCIGQFGVGIPIGRC